MFNAIFTPSTELLEYTLTLIVRQYGNWIYMLLCNQCLSPLKFRVWFLHLARCTSYNFMG